MADRGTLVQVANLESLVWVWHFEVFATSLTNPPSGPLGTIDVDAATGAVINSEQTKATLYERGRATQHPLIAT